MGRYLVWLGERIHGFCPDMSWEDLMNILTSHTYEELEKMFSINIDHYLLYLEVSQHAN